MDQTYIIRPTSRDSAHVADVALRDPAAEANAVTRRILRAEVVNNAHDAAAPLKACIMHQRRHSVKDPWEDADAFNLATLKASQEIKLSLNCDETYRLYCALRDLYQTYANKGIPSDTATYRVVDAATSEVLQGEEREILRRWLDCEGPAFWSTLDDLKPGLLETHALAKLHETRRAQVTEFERQLAAGTWTEKDWERFFRENTWIFGQGLDYRFMDEIAGQPYLGGKDVSNAGGVYSDFLMVTRAQLRFTVIVDIKKPAAELVEARAYRNDAYAVGHEVVGGVAQVQSQCAHLAESALSRENVDHLEAEDIYTCEPQGILVIGQLEQLAVGTPAERRQRRSSFERFRRNLSNPQILTYDELFYRARYIVEEPYLDRDASAGIDQ